jgi:hypothetical protein
MAAAPTNRFRCRVLHCSRLISSLCFSGGVSLFVWLGNRPFGIQVASLIPYTCAIVLYTFAANRGLPRYLFGCPLVRRQMPRLAIRHLGFLVVLFVLQTEVIHFRSHLPGSWPLGTTIAVICAIVGFSQIMSNRSLLNRAHIENELD